jgi:hypothetical protein
VIKLKQSQGQRHILQRGKPVWNEMSQGKTPVGGCGKERKMFAVQE